MRTERFTVMLTAEEVETLKQMANDQQRSASNMVARLINEAAANYAPPEQLELPLGDRNAK